MYYGRKKGIIIAIILALLIVLVGVAGGVYAYFATDLLKSNDALFFKYMGKSLESLETTENMQLTSVAKLMEQMPYTIKGELTANIQNENYVGIYSGINQSKLDINAKVDPINEKSYAKADITYNQANLFTLEYANSNNIYALKSDEIVTAFIGFENKNLKQLATKIGINEDTIADELQIENTNKKFEITEAEKQHIIETYTAVIKENLPNSAFTKEKNIATIRDGITYNTTGYRLNISPEQLKQLEIAMLQKLRQDSITLNVITTNAKSLGLGDNYTEINNLTQLISDTIIKIQNTEVTGGGLSIIVYVDNGEVITTEVILKNSLKFTIYSRNANTMKTTSILVENLGATDLFSQMKINIVENKTSTQSTIDASINIDDDISISLYVNNEGSAANEELTTEAKFTAARGNNTIEVKYKQEMKFVEEITDMISLDRTNCGVLNDYTPEQVKDYIEKIGNKILEVFMLKAQTIGVNVTGGDVTPDMSKLELETHNNLYEGYKGVVTGTTLRSLSNIVKSQNATDGARQVKLTIDGADGTGTVTGITNTKKYNVELKYDDAGYINEIIATSQN